MKGPQRTSSLRGLARLIGVSEKAIRKALAAGVFSPGSIAGAPRGLPAVVDVARALLDWSNSGRRIRLRVVKPRMEVGGMTDEAAIGKPITADEMSLRVQVARQADTVFLFVHGRLGFEEASIRVPLNGMEARALSSLLTGAAAAADPAGHEEVIKQIAEMVQAHQLAGATLPGKPH